jgi:hypothetical protein
LRDELAPGAERLGTVTLAPDGPVVAGALGQWTFTLTVGPSGIDEGGTIKLAQRFASDWEAAQFDRPADSGYTTVTTTGEAKLRPRYDRKGHDRPWMNCIVIDVYDGSLAPGDTVTVTLGDRRHGSPGIRAQTFQETAHEFRILVDPTNACRPRPIAQSPKFPVIAGATTELVCVVPSDAIVGEAVTVRVKGQDRWGNPTPAPADVVLQVIGHPGDGHQVNAREVTFSAAGTAYIEASAGALRCRSNPITIHAQEPTLKKFWGDLHAQSDATVGTGTEQEYFAFARDIAFLDFCSHQGNDFQVTDEDWQKLNETTRAFQRDGRFVAFPGWEWSGNSPAGGDRNVWFLEEGMPIFRSSHWQVPHIPENELSPAPTAADLFARVREHVPLDKVLLGSHVGGRYADIRLYFDQELGPLVELVSCWGVFEWMLWDAFDKGYIVGIMCNSDGHKGRPGAEGPGAGQFGIANGLTCVLAEQLTRASIFAALKNRRCYGTTGARIDLDFTINDHPMGSILRADGALQVRATVHGTAPLEVLELYQGKNVVQSIRPAAFERLTQSKRLRVSWRGSRIRGRGRRTTWDGAIRITAGPRITSASANFDTPVDRITAATDAEVRFISQTTGDTDSIDLLLDRADRGRVLFDSRAGRCEIDLAELTDTSARQTFPFGGLDMSVTIERYPQQLTDTTLTLETPLPPPAPGATPWFVKATQTDGHKAWSSPIYLQKH